MNKYLMATCCIFFPVALLSPVDFAIADNGEITHAQPVEKLAIDGSLADWPKDMPVTPIVNRSGADTRSKEDFEAGFRIGYDKNLNSLYIALSVVDDSHFVHPVGEIHKTDQDKIHFYLDVEHSPRGSAPILFEFTDLEFGIKRLNPEWNPVNLDIDKSDVAFATQRVGTTTTYEFSIRLRQPLELNRTVGVDFFLIDRDDDDQQVSYPTSQQQPTHCSILTRHKNAN